ncbi:Protein kinase domain-containing protein [Madurella fahalii]|uniref:Protein kinase domain-containing protein n=1 Tax=Madurella fahalii TaxID=1157608 RepID=A0ABQ0G9X8_9PEZI
MEESFWRVIHTKAKEKGHVFIFHSQSGVPYVFLKSYGQGFQNKVQLVMNTDTTEIAVQKVSNDQMPLEGEFNLTKLPKDREIRMLDHLNALVRNPVNPDAIALNPRWATYISYEAAPHSIRLGARTNTVVRRVSYWKFCNGGCLADWSRSCKEDSPRTLVFPVSIVARCIAQVCQTLEFMYTADSKPIYHCDLHLSNIFVHFADDKGILPDFYIGDLGLTRTASESLADTLMKEQRDGLNAASGPVSVTTPPNIPPFGQRRQWDIGRFIDCLEEITRDIFRMKSGEQSESLTELRSLMSLVAWLNSQEAALAARNPTSRPPSLRPIMDRARKLEETARAIELNTEAYKAFCEFAHHRKHIILHSNPFVVSGEKSEAEEYGRMMVAGPWTVVRSI